jgi:hypothetical protein
LISLTDISGQRNRKYYDGPYITINNDIKEILWINKGRPKRQKVSATDTISLFNHPQFPKVDLDNLSFDADTMFSYSNVSHFAAISDIHGQYDLFIEILKGQGIIDTSSNWSFGEGHLVIVGDVFDRGDKVTECLWFLFDLEKQAKKAGGKVHLLLGNHEVMILHGDIGYIHPKYRYISRVSRRKYPELFSKETVLGQWLRSKNITVSINDYVFVHGGFSKKVIDKENSLNEINKAFKNDILPEKIMVHDTTQFLSELYFDNGPLWYRGYVNPKAFDAKQAEYILSKLKKDALVVGHTSMPQVVSLYDNRIVLVDSSIKFGKSGELLICNDDVLYRGLQNGDRMLLDSEDKEGKRSIFDYLCEVVDSSTILTIKTDVDHLLETKLDEKYQPSEVSITDDLDDSIVLKSRVKTRGNMRKKLCTIPPLKLDFNKTELRSRGFTNKDKVKLVLQCMDSLSHQVSMKKEYLVYELYREIDSLGLKAALIKINLINEDGEGNIYQGFILEDEENLARRVGGTIIEKGVVRPQSMQREALLKIAFFQYMIGNNDWSISLRKNVETLLLESEKRLVPVAFDFDYSGIVGQEYAAPTYIFPLMSMDQRIFMLMDLTKDELKSMQEFYNNVQGRFNQIIEEATYLHKDERQKFKEIVDDFYDLINSRRRSKVLVNIGGAQ